MFEKKESSKVKGYRVLNEQQESSSLYFDTLNEMWEYVAENEISAAAWSFEIIK